MASNYSYLHPFHLCYTSTIESHKKACNPVRNKMFGGGIPSNPVPVITATGHKLLVSVGSTNPLAGSESVEAGILGIDPLAPDLNFYYMWWREL